MKIRTLVADPNEHCMKMNTTMPISHAVYMLNCCCCLWMLWGCVVSDKTPWRHLNTASYWVRASAGGHDWLLKHLQVLLLLPTEDEEEQVTALTHGTLKTNLNYAAAAASGRRCCRIVISMAKFLLMAQWGEGFETLTQVGKGDGGGGVMTVVIHH